MNKEVEGTLLAFLVLLALGLEPAIIRANPSNPIGFITLSIFSAALILWVVLLATGRFGEIREKPAELKKTFLTGLFATAIAYSLYSLGTSMSTAVNSAIITRLEVFYSLAIGWLLLRERVSGKALTSSLLLFGGVFLVLTQGKLITPRKGDLLLLLTPLFWQLGHTVAKFTDYSPLTIATLRNTFGFLLLLPLALLSGIRLTKPAVAEGIIIATTQTLWYASISRINLSKATAILTPAPVVTIAVAIAFLGEKVGVYHLLGFLLVTIGTLLIAFEESGKR
ncbi:DMT family transporter [Thermococcus peptonophilus]|uniref:Permease n=1 Tax=Thermococcus peptonophilus TaxID=53952 RepID=A0A142CVC5_9EURY|nr:DMT family transporter [Thermococcus peptonophilus]AMQ18727.1 permease [Thermococcus peptonophilus]